MAMRMPAGSGAPPGQRPDGPRPEPGYPAGTPGGYGTGPDRTYRGDSGGYPIDPLDPAYPVPGGRYPEEPSTGSYRRPAQEYDTGTGYPADPGYQDGPGGGDYRPGAATGYPDVPATGDYRTAQSGSHRRDPGDFPGEPAPVPLPRRSRPGRNTGMRTSTARTTTPATRMCRVPVTTAPRSPAATAVRRAATRVTPLSTLIPARRALRIIPAKRPPTTPGLIPRGRIMARAPSGMTRPTTPSRTTAVSPRNPSPMGPRPAITTAGNGDAIPAVIDG